MNDMENRIEKLMELAQQVNMPDAYPSRKRDVEIALTARPDLFFETAPSRGYVTHRIGTHGVLGDLIPDGHDPDRFVPRFTASWDAAKKLMLPNWCIESFSQWFNKGCEITLTEGHQGATGTWYHTANELQISQQGPTDIGVLLAAILLSYAESMRIGRVNFEPRLRSPFRREPPAETHGDMG